MNQLEDSETGLLSSRTGKEITTTNPQEWMRGWKGHNNSECEVHFQEELRKYNRERYVMAVALQCSEREPLMTIF